MTVKTHAKANHTQSVMRPVGIKVKTQVKAGGVRLKHNPTLVSVRAQ